MVGDEDESEGEGKVEAGWGLELGLGLGLGWGGGECEGSVSRVTELSLRFTIMAQTSDWIDKPSRIIFNLKLYKRKQRIYRHFGGFKQWTSGLKT